MGRKEGHKGAGKNFGIARCVHHLDCDDVCIDIILNKLYLSICSLCSIFLNKAVKSIFKNAFLVIPDLWN